MSLSFEPPGPGKWTLDTGHFPRPVTRFSAEIFPQAAIDGFREGTEPYGLLLDFVEWAFVHRWAYACPRPVPEVRERAGADRETWEATVRSSAPLARRLATNEKVFERRPWRAELSIWEDRVKPTMIDAHRQLQSVDPERLDGEDLLTHLHRCRQSLRLAIRLHHRFNVTPVLPVGDLLAHAERWDGVSPTQLLELLPRSSPLDAAAGQVAAVAEPVPAGEVTADGLDLVGNWVTGAGTDVADARLVEVPHLLLEAVRAGVRRHGLRPHDGEDRAAQLRPALSPPDRGLFDDLLSEARAVHHLRDERALYCDVWANGLARRAILAAGNRLAEEGLIERPEHLVEASYAEMQSLVGTGSGPPGEELAGRAQLRHEARAADAPGVLGESGHGPVPTGWLSPGAARTERAFRRYLAAMSDGPGGHVGGPVVQGTGASAGLREGRARVVHDPAELDRVGVGDVLVAEATSPAFNVVLGLVGAVVTDRGGLLSHAAIVAREYGIPAVVGCGDATARIPGGARVRVDGRSGEVTVLTP